MTIKLSRSDSGKFRQLLQIDQHELVADARFDPESDSGPNPHDLYDAALAACKAITLLMYAEQARIPLEDVHITIDRDSSEERSGKYHLHVGLVLIGQLDPTQKDRLEKVAAKCPVHKLMTTVETTITTTCEAIQG
ncbi:OsmC family protein [Pseudomonas sp. OIL-1]|uniref:OsmC family protein n=1 Tax=Pseudomonas sp. OIL-1 TaxID=2706126 RepID=UPI0013A7976E|nr:OsmC family protein [Pseudomonas sp. OIL-1]QIB52332.1 OsmC family protein [Pseudomonas sp. OIL-1]